MATTAAPGGHTCPDCGARLDGDPAVCPECGTALSTEVSQPADVDDQTSAPLGIKVICALVGLSAILTLVVGIGLLITEMPAYPTMGPIIGGVLLVVGLLHVPVFYGLWFLRSWGWVLAMVLYGLNFLLNVVRFGTGDATATVALLVSAGIIYYLYAKRDLYGY